MVRSAFTTKATIRSARWLAPLLLMFYSGIALAHGQEHKPNPWHKLEFWNGEFHLFAMIFWLAMATIVVALLVKVVKRLKQPQHKSQ